MKMPLDKLRESHIYPGEYFTHGVTPADLTTYRIYCVPCGAMTLGDYIHGVCNGQIIRVDRVNYKVTRKHLWHEY